MWIRITNAPSSVIDNELPERCTICCNILFMLINGLYPAVASDSSSRVTIIGDWKSTRVMFFTEWLDSSHIQWLESRARVILTKCLSSWWTNPVRLHTKKWAVFASMMIKIGGNFLFCLSSRTMLHFMDQVSPTWIEGELRFCFHWGVSRAQYIDTLSWFNVVFAYRDHGSGPHTATLSLYQIPVK